MSTQAVSGEDAPKLRPYMDLATKLGSFAGQVIEKNIRSVRIEYEGHAAHLNQRPLTACVLTGLLQPQLETVNMVNAPVVARERNIAVTEVKHDRAVDYQTLIRITIDAEDRKRHIAGTLIADKPRIVEIDTIAIEAEFFPNVLYIRNQDKPGFVGNLGRTLGDSGINIATFHMGRIETGGDAICLVLVDQPVGETVLNKVRGLPHVVKARLLSF